MDLFGGIYNSIMSALGADKTLFGPSVDKGITKEGARLSGRETRRADQATQNTQVLRTRTPTPTPTSPPKSPPKSSPTSPLKSPPKSSPTSPPTSSPPTPPQKQSAVEKKRKVKAEDKREQRTEAKETKSIIRKKRLKKLGSFFKKLKKREEDIIKKQIEEYDIVEKYVKEESKRNRMTTTEIKLEVGSVLENLEKYKAFLKLAKLSKQDTDTTLAMGQYSANRGMLAHKSSHNQEWTQFRNKHEELFNSLANAGLDPLNQNNKQGVPSNSPKPNKTAQTLITSGPPLVRGG